MGKLDKTFKVINERYFDGNDNYAGEFEALKNEFGDKAVNSLFSSGLDGYIDSRKRGNYSVDAIKQNLKPHPASITSNKNDVNEMSNWGKTKANPKYSHFAILKGIDPRVDGKIVNGWEYRDYDPAELRSDKQHYFFGDIKDMQINPKNVAIVTTKYLQKQSIDPYDYNNWLLNTKDMDQKYDQELIWKIYSV